MKKSLVLVILAAAIIIFPYCSPTRKASAPAVVAKTTYASEVQTAVTSYCSPCHLPSKGGKKKAYDNYANLKEDIDEIIQRIELHPGQKGFMPFKNPRLSDSTIAMFKKWREDGLMEN